MTHPARLLIGRIYRPHGTGGAFKIIPESDDPARLVTLERVFVGKTADAARPMAFTSCRLMPTKHGATLLVEAEGVDTPDTAEKLRGLNVYAAESDLPLAEGEYFLHDLIGLRVEDEEGNALGEVVEVREGPMYELLDVRTTGGARVLVPDVPAFVVSMDLEARRVVLRPIEGLMDDAA